jgi:predicted NACHT family NTPase
MAEAAFKKGSYCIANCKDKSFRKNVEANKDAAISVSPLKYIDSDIALTEYEMLRPLCRLATVNELSGIFRFPVGGNFSPCCFRKNTDPPQEKVKDMIVLGHDMEIGGNSITNFVQPRGVRYDKLNTHFFITAMPGSGKTTVVMNLALQLQQQQFE